MLATTKSRILIMEDDPINLRLLTCFLDKQYTLFSAMTGQEALEIIRSEEIDLAILDIMMPDIDGYEVCKKIKNTDKTCFVPVLIITALSRKEDKIKGLECGADEFLTKPFNNLEVEVRVKTLLEKRKLQLSYIQEGKKLKNYLDATKSLFAVINKDQKVEFVNKKCCELLGFEESQIVGHNWLDLVISEDKKEGAKETFNQILADSDTSIEKTECEILVKNNEKRILRYKCSHLCDENEDSERYVFSGIDITKEKELENLTAKYTEELEFSNSINHLMKDVMRYELLAPTNSAKEMIDNILQMENNEYKMNILDSVKKTLEAVENTITEASYFAEIEPIEKEIVEECNCVSLLKELINQLEFEAQAKNVSIIFNCQNSFKIFSKGPIKDILKFMLNNAISRSPVNSVIKIDMVELKDFLQIKFFDYGPKIVTFNHLISNDAEVSLKSPKNTNQMFTLLNKILNLYGGKIGVETSPECSGFAFYINIKK